mmetsp:Transcript_27862/g.77932  ORF Transcript_27862/g.77932 Transcript_27862/m.77932 type:complete len:375 (-) Transcript_27862:60-1184(-)
MAETDNVQEWKSILVDRVKTLQRSSHEVKLEWYAHCKKSGCAHFDPNRYDPDFLLNFLGKFQPGGHGGAAALGGGQACREPAAGPGAAAQEPAAKKVAGQGGKWFVVEKVKDIQRSSSDNRKCWYAFCQSQCTSNYDPARHDEVFLRKFVEAFDSGQLGRGPAGAGKGGKPSGGSSWSEWDGGGAGGWWGCESSEWDGSGSDYSSWSGKGAGASSGGDSTGEDSWASAPPMVAPTAYAAMMKGKAAMMKGMEPQDAVALGKGFFAAMMEKGMAMGKGPALDAAGSAGRGGGAAAGYAASLAGRGTAAMGFQGANNKLVSSSTRNLSEFGILDVPLDEARMSAKRGFASISVEQGSGGLMTEEQAREFQKSLRRR